MALGFSWARRLGGVRLFLLAGSVAGLVETSQAFGWWGTFDSLDLVVGTAAVALIAIIAEVGESHRPRRQSQGIGLSFLVGLLGVVAAAGSFHIEEPPQGLEGILDISLRTPTLAYINANTTVVNLEAEASGVLQADEIFFSARVEQHGVFQFDVACEDGIDARCCPSFNTLSASCQFTITRRTLGSNDDVDVTRTLHFTASVREGNPGEVGTFDHASDTKSVVVDFKSAAPSMGTSPLGGESSSCTADGHVVIFAPEITIPSNGYLEHIILITPEPAEAPVIELGGSPNITNVAIVTVERSSPGEWTMTIDHETPFPAGSHEMHLSTTINGTTCSAPIKVEITDYNG